MESLDSRKLGDRILFVSSGRVLTVSPRMAHIHDNNPASASKCWDDRLEPPCPAQLPESLVQEFLPPDTISQHTLT